MKKFLFRLKETALSAVLFYALAGCATLDSGIVSLDNAIQLSAKELESALPNGVKIAVLSFKSDSQQFSDYVIEELMGGLVKGKKLVVVDRNSLDLVRQEWNFQSSGEVSDDSAQSIGKILGAQAVVSGNLIDMGNAYRFRIYSLNVETAAREASAMITIRKDDQIAYLLKDKQAASDSAVKSAAEGVWQGLSAYEFEELRDFTVTVTGTEGILKYDGNDGYSDESRNFAKGTVTVRGNSVTGILTHLWGNVFSEDLGKYWLTVKDFCTALGEDESEIMAFAVWHGEFNGNVLTVTPPRELFDDASNVRWIFVKQ